jgi:hypothetical protein
MNAIPTRSWSTPLIIGAGLFVAISGILMFWGVHHPVEFAHEWIGMLFAFAILAHILTHWKPFKRYFTQPFALILISMVFVVTLGFITVSATNEGGNVIMNMVHSVETASLAEVAPLVDEGSEGLVSRFRAKGFSIADAGQSIQEIAQANDVESKALIKLLFESR